MSSNDKIALRTEENKQLLIEQLKKTPVVQVACQKVGIGRASYYRWRNEDPEFKQITDLALYHGKKLISDLAESQLINAIKEGNTTSILFWLKNHHKDYKTKLELSGKIKTESEILSPEQEESIRNALKLADFNSNNSVTNKQDE